MSAADLYRAIVLDHNRAPRNLGTLAAPTHMADGVNAMCGDSLRVELRVAEGHIEAMRFQGECCAITMAAASMLSERVQGLDASALESLSAQFAAHVRGDTVNTDLGDLAAFGELQRYPARRKCALLPFATTAAALAGLPRTTTEKDTP
ncbi:Fe-S cluster assembly sulfur transfer protein SufU [Tahibacter amnicola]|uniref:SUF system NifU family Fe-S cluster assembly protein n=1 Tax=Tahibacter amnicola TaxID=2976241 RepID=A0ABY6BEY0_9GAMM|nr:SUF system NifU family Fe-S cluster assembly protein [Tahibacter amnicola]UXI67166.1 SUF system NifU family Fe-S cluster assembly protein [Tahibacter amnicola]